jgi:hypothetical protein
MRIEDIKYFQVKCKSLGDLARDTTLKTKYYVVSTNLKSLIDYIENNKTGRYE